MSEHDLLCLELSFVYKSSAKRPQSVARTAAIMAPLSEAGDDNCRGTLLRHLCILSKAFVLIYVLVGQHSLFLTLIFFLEVLQTVTSLRRELLS